MTEPKRLPIDPQRTESREDKIKKIPLPSLEKEFYDLISEAERYKEQQKNQSDSWQLPICIVYLDTLRKDCNYDLVRIV